MNSIKEMVDYLKKLIDDYWKNAPLELTDYKSRKVSQEVYDEYMKINYLTECLEEYMKNTH